MTPDVFRRIALGMEGVIEKAHHGHPDFRVGGRIFASLGYPDRKHGMVVLTPEQQQSWVRRHAAAFVPVTGSWGEQGCTNVRLGAVDEDALGEALTVAWQNAVTKGPTARAKGRRSTGTARSSKGSKTKSSKTKGSKRKSSKRTAVSSRSVPPRDR